MARASVKDDLVGLGVEAARAEVVAAAFAAVAGFEARLAWQRLTEGPLRDASLPFAAHQLLHERVFADWDEAAGPRPVVIPAADAAASRIGRLMRARKLRDFAALHAWSVTDRAGFWQAAIEELGVVFRTPPQAVLDDSGGPRSPRWLPGARYNVAESCFRAPAAAAAIVSPGATAEAPLAVLSYGELRAQVGQVAAALLAAGFRPGDALAIDMPMTPAAVVIYLGIVWAGMRVVSIADSLAAAEVGTRLLIARAAGLFTAYAIDRGGKRLPLYEKLLPASPPRAIVLDGGGATLRDGDLAWEAFLAAAGAAPEPYIDGPGAITNVLFSSGTTGEPKAIPWTQLTPIKAATDAAFHFDVHPGDVVAWPTNLGWMMGPWLIYASLINGAAMALYPDAPTTRGFGAFAARAGVSVLGLVPSIVKAWRADDRLAGIELPRLRCFGSTGEASNPVDYFWLMSRFGYRPVIEYCGGTEIGGGYLTGTLLQPAAPATFSTPALGSELVILDEAGQPADNGEVYLVPPTLGYSESLLNRDHDEVYFAGTPPGPAGAPLRRHGDQIERLGGGYYRALGRVDDTMNLGGIKVSSAEIERVLDGVPGVRRTAAIAVNPAGGGPSELVVFAVAEGERASLLPQLQAAIKAQLNPLFRIADLVVVESLPVTASNKIMRRELRAGYRRS